MMFHIGQKVVFIGPDLSAHPEVLKFGLNCPAMNSIYTIRSRRLFFLGAPGYLLSEIVNDIIPPLTQEMLIDERYLRPLIERKTDISFAHEILRKESNKERA